MRCEDAIRELPFPLETSSETALSQHLAHCARCASEAERAAKLGRLWEATRPAALSDATWERIWANASATLDRPEASRRAAAPAWRRAVFATFALAQAAAILAAVVLLPRGGNQAGHPSAPHPTVAKVESAPRKVEIDQDQVVLITLDQRGVHVRDIALNSNANTVDEFFLFYNAIEPIAALQ